MLIWIGGAAVLAGVCWLLWRADFFKTTEAAVVTDLKTEAGQVANTVVQDVKSKV